MGQSSPPVHSDEQICTLLENKHSRDAKESTKFGIELFGVYCNVNYGLEEVSGLDVFLFFFWGGVHFYLQICTFKRLRTNNMLVP